MDGHKAVSLLRLWLVIGIASLGVGLPTAHNARAAASHLSAADIIFLPGTARIEPALQDALKIALADAPAATANATYFAVTSLQSSGDWQLISLAGFARPNDAGSWSLEDATWVGIALAERQPDGAWLAAVEKTSDFALLLQRAPDALLDANAKASLMPGPRPLAAQSSTYYRFPWQPGANMYYGTLGIHAGGYASLGTYLAVDFLSDGNTSAGHAPNMLLAAAAGSINYVCKGTYNTAIRIGEVMYLHLQITNTNLYVGHYFGQGDPIGPLQPGSFSDGCGWASQGANWFHVHWAFPDTGTFQAEGWTLTWTSTTTLSTVPWQRGSLTVAPGQWMHADNILSTYLPLVLN
ncbi:MAG: hypothetical protein M1434_01680 [Chloroflexi bacterium]|nr:hypothetical protein [Chloroflexota bacterium]MCL5273439.1 hypothetical protein [Chloroflexota bacterium]